MTDNETAIVKKDMVTGGGGLVLTGLSDMSRFANMIVASGMGPRSLDRPEKVLVALEWGLELGLKPMAALKSIAVINGVATIYGDMALAMVRQADVLKSFKETVDGEDDKMKACVFSHRKGMDEPNEPTVFTVDDAKTAGLWGKTGPWKTHPKRMLKYKARAFHLRDNYSDILLGLHITEEMEGERDLQNEYKPEAKVEVAARDDRTGDPEKDITIEPDADITMSDRFTGLVKEVNPTLDDKIIDSLYDQFVSYVLGGVPGAWNVIGLNADEITQLSDALMSGLPQAIKDLVPIAVPDVKPTEKPAADDKSKKSKPTTNKDLFEGSDNAATEKKK